VSQPSSKEVVQPALLNAFQTLNEIPDTTHQELSKSSSVTQLTERVFPRLRMKAEYQVCIGFEQIFSSLPSMDDGWCSVEEEKDEPQINQLSESPEGDLLRFSSYEEVMADVALENSEVSSVDVLDASAGGFCLEVDPRVSGYPKIGEVLGVRETQKSEWKLCVIRWSRPSSEGAQLGVELLALSAYKTLLRDPYTEAVVSPAIYIPGISLMGLPESVLLPQSRSVTGGDKALVRRFGEDTPYMMDKTGLITGSVKRLFISQVEANKPAERADIATSDIWATF